jgi:hypothetical protein
LHLSFSPPYRDVRAFGAIVQSMTHFMKVTEAQVTECSAVGLQLVRHDLCRTYTLFPRQFPHKSKGGPLVPALLDQDVKDLALTINSAPQIHLLASNIHKDFVQVPDVERGIAAPADPASIGSSEFQNPQTNRFVTDIDTALDEQVLYISVAHGEAEVEPYGLPDNVRVKAVASVRDFAHTTIVSAEYAITVS